MGLGLLFPLYCRNLLWRVCLEEPLLGSTKSLLQGGRLDRPEKPLGGAFGLLSADWLNRSRIWHGTQQKRSINLADTTSVHSIHRHAHKQTKYASTASAPYMFTSLLVLFVIIFTFGGFPVWHYSWICHTVITQRSKIVMSLTGPTPQRRCWEGQVEEECFL